MPVNFYCQFCGSTIDLTNEYGKSRIICPSCQKENIIPKLQKANNINKSAAPQVLSIIGMFAWFLPIIGLPVSIIGLVLSIKELNNYEDKSTKIWITLSIIGIVLSLINASIGAYMGATGQHPLINNLK